MVNDLLPSKSYARDTESYQVSSSRDVWLIKAMPVVFVLIWSTGFIVARFGMPHAPPMTFLSIRYILSLLCFLPWIFFSKALWPRSSRQFLHLGLTGIFMHACYLGGVWSAIKDGMGAGLTALIVGLQPVLTAVWLSFLGQVVTRRQWVGFVLGFLGLILVVSGKLGVGGEATLANVIMATIGLLGITIGTLYQKKFVTSCDVRTASFIQLAAALVVTTPLSFLESSSIEWGDSMIGAMAWSVLALTLGASSLLYMLIQRGAATSVSSLMYLVPPMTAFFAWVLFFEAVTWVTVLGTVITALGVSLVIRPEPLKSNFDLK